MEYYQPETQTFSDPIGPLSRPPSPQPSPADNSLVDSITSLMTMAENMDALLPTDVSFFEPCDIDIPTNQGCQQMVNQLTDDDVSSYRTTPFLSTIKDEPRTNLNQDIQAGFLDHNTNLDFFSSLRKTPAQYEQCGSADNSTITNHIETNTSHRTSIESERSVTSQPSIPDSNTINSLDSDHNMKKSFPDTPYLGQQAIARAASMYVSQQNTSPCSIRDLNPFRNPINSTPAATQKIQKTTRKPKTYSKPVASRFCHICSRMPRRGQGSLTCRRMAEGLCRKIVCEQCLREQGWCYDEIIKNPSSWLCPHCAGVCPPRSQCHIYNRINARRKKVGSQNKAASLPAALASSDLLLGPYSHLFSNGQATNTTNFQILQPPPNFKLNLPSSYSGL